MLSAANCKHCGSYRLKPSKVNGVFGHFLGLVLTPYRCRACNSRQFKLNCVRAGDPSYDVPLDHEDVVIALPAQPTLSPICGPFPSLLFRFQEAVRSARPWVVLFAEPLLRIGMVLLSVELTLQFAAGVVWFMYRPAVPRQSNGEQVILCVGDSYTRGIGPRVTKDSYVPELERLLNHDKRQWRVANAGLPGRNSRDAVLILEDQLPKVHPRAVYVMVGWDDGWSQPAKLEPGHTAKGALAFQWRWRTARFAELLLSTTKGVTAERLASSSRSAKSVAVRPSGPSPVGTWLFQGQIVRIREDHLLQFGKMDFEWHIQGSHMEVTPLKAPGLKTSQYEWEQRDGGVFVKSDQFPKGILLEKVNDVTPATTPVMSEEPFAPATPVENTLAVHLLEMADFGKSAHAVVVFMSYPFHGQSVPNRVAREAASRSGAGWLDVEAAFAEHSKTAGDQDLYRTDGQLNDRGHAFLANLVAADLRVRKVYR